MTTYKLRLVYDRSYKMTKGKSSYGYDDYFRDVDIPKSFDSLTKARSYAIRLMDDDRRIHDVQVSNPKYLDVWQVYTGVQRTDDGKYYWSAIRPSRTVGAGHLVNKDGSLSKRTIYD